MPVYSVNEVGAVGLIDPVDKRPYEMPPQAWSFVLNARMINKVAKSVNGWTQTVFINDPNIHNLDYYTMPGVTTHWYAYGNDKIYSIDESGTVTTVSKGTLVGGTYPSNIWISDKFNQLIVCTNNLDPPQCFYEGGPPVTPATISQDLPDWGAGGTYDGARCLVIRAYKNFLVALNVTEGSQHFPNLVAWSDAGEPGLLPASWDYADPTTLAGRTVLGAGCGCILAAEVLRDSLYIYTEYEIWRMDFVGGQFVMRFTRVFSNQGAFGPRCVGKFGSGHMVVTNNDIIAHDGQQQRSIADEKIRNRLFASITDADSNVLWVSPFLRTSEMWIGLPGSGVPSQTQVFNVNEGNNTAIVWQWAEEGGPWSVRELPDSRYMRELPTIQSNQVDDTWDAGSDESWDAGPDVPWSANVGLGDLVPIITSTDENLYYADFGEQQYDTILRREDFSLSSELQSDMIVAVYPRVSGPNSISIRTGHSNTAEGALTWDRVQPFRPDEDYHITQRSQGRRHAIEFIGKGFNLFGYDVEFQPAGRR